MYKLTISNDIQILNRIENELKSIFINYNVFQTFEMYQVYNQTQNFEPLYFVVLDDENGICGSLIVVILKEHSGLLGRFSSRAIIWGGPLIKDHDLKTLDFILKEFNSIVKKKAIYTEFRNMWEYSEKEKQIFAKNGFFFEDHLDIIHNLNISVDEMFAKMHKGRRKNIRRAIRYCLEFEEIENKDELIVSLNLIKLTYKRVKLPLPDDSLFISVYEIMQNKGMAKFFKTTFEGTIIAVRFVFSFNNLIYDWYVGVDERYLCKYPNDFMPYNIMKWGGENGFTTFQFGGAGKPNIPYGVRDYKLKFGGKLVNWGRFEKVNQPVMMKLGKIGFKLWKRLYL